MTAKTFEQHPIGTGERYAKRAERIIALEAEVARLRAELARARAQEPVATNTPTVSREHLVAIAEKCGILGGYRTREMVDAIVGYARVVLNNVAVQEAFICANPSPIPEGMVLVPKEPTEAMLKAVAGYPVGDSGGCCPAPEIGPYEASDIYKAMLAAVQPLETDHA